MGPYYVSLVNIMKIYAVQPEMESDPSLISMMSG